MAPARDFQLDGAETLTWLPGRLRSLWDMMNFMIPHYMTALRLVQQEISLAQANIHGRQDSVIDGRHKDRIRQNLQYVLKKADDYDLEGVHHRLERIYAETKPDNLISWAEIARQMLALLEAFEDDTKLLYLYAYPKEKGRLFVKAKSDWAATIKAFPALTDDIEKAIDLYALGHNLACVFHLMRIMEVGVQRFGKRLGVSLTKLSANRLTDLNWHQILDAINPKLKAIDQTTKAGKAKHERLSAIQSYLYGVKDAWRNPTMHPRKAGYTDAEAVNLINHARSFMNELASVISPKKS